LVPRGVVTLLVIVYVLAFPFFDDF
jgi:hypothetical protein